jgi:hypothetical protein
MTDKNIKNKQTLIEQLRGVAEKETVWLEKTVFFTRRNVNNSIASLNNVALQVMKSLPKNKSSVSTLPCMNLDEQACGTWLLALTVRKRI